MRHYEPTERPPRGGHTDWAIREADWLAASAGDEYQDENVRDALRNLVYIRRDERDGGDT